MRGKNTNILSFCFTVRPPFPFTRASFCPSCFLSFISFCHFGVPVLPLYPPLPPVIHPGSLIVSNLSLQKRKTTTISVEVKKSQHKYIIGPKGNTLQEILEATGVSVEMPPLDSGSETIILRGEPDRLGPALTQVYAKVRRLAESE